MKFLVILFFISVIRACGELVIIRCRYLKCPPTTAILFLSERNVILVLSTSRRELTIGVILFIISVIRACGELVIVRYRYLKCPPPAAILL